MAADKRPTIKDVAAHAGVSKSTVSLVLQNSDLVKKETRATVFASMKALNYVRNRAAATLRGAGTGLIGMLINDLRNPFFTEFAASAQMAFYQQGYATVVANCDEDPEIQEQTVRKMLEHDVTALLISPCYGDVAAAFDVIAASGIPALQVLRHVDADCRHLPFFSHDYVAGSRLAVEHLLQQGIRRIAFIGGIEGRDITRDRMRAYVEEMQARSLPAIVIPGRPTRRFGRNMARRVVTDLPKLEAAICFNDLVALGMQAGLMECGKRPGETFFLVGFDDIEEAQLAFPSLTTVRCDIGRFGEMSAERLLRQIRDGVAPPQDERLPVELVIRESSVRSV
ncbi:MAG: LacI family DNA-binding transcriptional regulator [Paracoccaceae bacterium]|nr:LacI family DNA-binding transcriptional regulator [Paracoccaceae bacterium]